jgi:hypothetical protein
MRRAALLLVCLVPNLAVGEPVNTRPKGKLIDPFARMPHPRDGMKLPDPRQAAEKAASEHDAHPLAPPSEPAPAPATPVATPVTSGDMSASSPAPSSATAPGIEPSQVTAAPTGTSAGTFPAFRRSKTPFGVTTMRIKIQHPVEDPPLAVTRSGLTVEAGTGVGWIALWDDDKSTTSPGGVAGLSLGIGGWLDESVALTARLSGSSIPGSNGVYVAGFLGPSLQIWVTDRTWLGAGLGLAMFGRESRTSSNEITYGGFGADLRIGRTFYANGKHTLNGSLELTPSQVSREDAYGNDAEMNVASIGVLFGWQYL